MTRSPDIDPARHVAQPVARALDGLILGAAGSFFVSVIAVLAAIEGPAGLLHDVAHVLIPTAMGIVLVARAVFIVRRRQEGDPDPWARARSVDRWDTVLAQILTIAVPLAWLAGCLAILVHHAPDLYGPGLVIGATLPMGAALWILASFAWHDFCRDRIAAAVSESDRRYRQYWQDVARP